MNERIAIIIDVANFDDPALSSLPGARTDGDRIEAFARDSTRGAFSNTVRLKDPTLQELKGRLADAIEFAAKGPSNTTLIYFATHGLTSGPYGLYLTLRDTRADRISTSGFSLSELTALIEEHRPAQTITVVDVCNAGGHVAGTASLSRDKLWRDLTRSDEVREGHFFAVACATRENANENANGGEFTSALMAAIDSTGRAHPSDEWLSVEQLMNELVRVGLTPQQTPEWTGVAVSVSVPLSRNPHHDPALPTVHGSVQTLQLDVSERSLAKPAIRLHWNAMQLVGTGHPWLHIASAALDQLTTLLPDKAEPMVKQMFTSLDQAVTKYGNASDRVAQTHYARAVIVTMGRLMNAVPDIVDVVRRIAERIERETSDLQAFLNERAWLAKGDAAANAPLSTLRFWRRLGVASFVALCARQFHPDGATKLANLVRDLVVAKPELHRVAWMGQYCDLACTLGLVACVSEDAARTVATTILDRLIQKTDQPVSPELHGRDLGRALAMTLLEVEPDDDWLDEGMPLCIAMLHLSNEVRAELDRRITQLSTLRAMAFYEEELLLDVTVKTMSIREPNVILADQAALNAFLKRVDGLSGRPMGPSPDKEHLSMILSLSGAAHFQNRAGIWAVSHIRKHWITTTIA